MAVDRQRSDAVTARLFPGVLRDTDACDAVIRRIEDRLRGDPAPIKQWAPVMIPILVIDGTETFPFLHASADAPRLCTRPYALILAAPDDVFVMRAAIAFAGTASTTSNEPKLAIESTGRVPTTLLSSFRKSIWTVAGFGAGRPRGRTVGSSLGDHGPASDNALDRMTGGRAETSRRRPIVVLPAIATFETSLPRI